MPLKWIFNNVALSIVSLITLLSQIEEAFADSHDKSGNDSHHADLVHLQECVPGLLFPVWEPQTDIEIGDRIIRGIFYFLGMIYMFLGVSIVSDRFMAAIEVITAREKEVRVTRPNGEVQLVVVRIWNETVANLTLMALGSSAPEILLSVIEICGNGLDAGELGPGTIVGSAAFNLLIIIGLCIVVIPNGEIRRIKHLRVFFVTASWSIFAYIWLLVILKFSSPGEVEVWEAAITLLCFPLTVGTAYVADRRLLFYKYLSKTYRANKRGIMIEGEGQAASTSSTELKKSDTELLQVSPEEEVRDDVAEFEQNRRDYMQLLHELRKRNPTLTPEKLEDLAREEILAKGPKSRAFYRMQATRKLVGGQNLIKRMQERAAEENAESLRDKASTRTSTIKGPKVVDKVTNIFFDPAHYTVLENIGKFGVNVVRDGGDLSRTVLVDYQTEEGTATAGADYYAVIGTITFGPGEIVKTITIEVIDDEEFEEDEHFYVRLSKPRFAPAAGTQSPSSSPKDKKKKSKGSALSSDGVEGKDDYVVQLTSPFLATVMILDDDHGGVFNIVDTDIETTETVGNLDIKVARWSGARGRVSVKYTTVDGTALAGRDYEPIQGTLTFQNNEIENSIEVKIMDTDSYEKDLTFFVEISDPSLVGEENHKLLQLMRKNPKDLTNDEKIALEGIPKLGNDRKATIHIKESKEFKNTVDRLVQQTNASMLIGTSTWREQFREAFTAEGDEDNPGAVPGIGTYIVHFLLLFWKVLFAFIPPTDIYGGYVTFVSSIVVIGGLTAAIGDVSSHFGCSVGLRDTVTSIIFVALGTSIPDTFASKVAAIQDEFADASIGNVTGSNAVNVFLGIGIAWTIAAVFHQYIKCNMLKPSPKCVPKFIVDPGSLAFSVTLFCGCAAIAVFVMLLRRLEIFGGGELGGPKRFKYPTGILFFSLWLFYIVMSSLEAYKHIQGF